MSNKKKIIPENLDEEQERTLNEILNLIIPPSNNGEMPGVLDVDFLAYIHKENHLQWIRKGLNIIIEESHNKYGRELSELNSNVQTQLIDKLGRRVNLFFQSLTTQVMHCYYQHDDVLEAIGLEARTPFPEGYFITDGEISLLEPVYLRGKIYRD